MIVSIHTKSHASMSNVIQILRERGLIEASTPDLEELATKPLRLYCGFDPTADSLHLGNLLGIVVLSWFQRYGHQPIALVGGATGSIGDPGGKSVERPLIPIETLQANTQAIHRQLELLLNRDSGTAMALPVYNNYDWLGSYSFLEFLRDVGKHFRLGTMLAKEMVRTRLQSDEGMSFTEFSYQLLQSYDFLHLYRSENIVLQIGGSDQWGNITAGIELIRKVLNQPAAGMVFPLLTRSDGQKFGKSEKGAIWLSADRLSPYDFYQHLYRVEDIDALKLLRMLTFLPLADLYTYEKEHAAGLLPPNSIQKRLAEEVTRFVHGEEGLASAIAVTAHLAPGKDTALDGVALAAVVDSLPKVTMAASSVIGASLLDCLMAAALVPSKGEGRRMVRNGGVYLNNRKIPDENYTLKSEDLIDQRFLILAAGKKNKVVVDIAESQISDETTKTLA